MLSIPGYQTSSIVSDGKNSIVYRASHQADDKSVILKVLRQDYPSPEELTRYWQEYEITKSLNFDGVIKTCGIETYQNTLVIVLEDFGGESLKQFIADSPFSVKAFLPLAILISDSLGQIHAANIIHKDINPANIVWNQKTSQLKIIDFGIASRLPRENPTLKNPEQLEGTLSYISPEQTGRMNRALDYRTDLYSLGVTFYELLTGKVPFEPDSAMELVHCHIAKAPKPVCEIKPDVPLIISDIVMKLMAKNVEDRYQSAFGVKADLEKVQENLTGAENQPGFENLADLDFELAQNDFSGKLQIPQKLYGRENEINTLLQAFERVSEGATEMMLIAGYSGVGKTALVHEVHKPMTEKHGYFAAGKFDQFQRNVPYSAITQAFNQFCHYLLTESAETLASWQTSILEAMGNNGQIVIDVIPDLELVIGPQPAVAKIGASEAQNRFNMFFVNFVKVLCNKEHPFILFIDDLQWVDLASLGLLKNIMLDDEIKQLFIIGAYRDNEVDSSHPFVMAMNELEKTHATINFIKLANLQAEDVNHLLQESLNCEAVLTQPLTDLIYQKTQGNAFFAHQFLHTLYFDTLLHFDFEQRQWQWEIEKIAAQNITDNVVDLMANKIDKLPANTSKVLQLAACVGNQFDLSILAIIYEQDKNETLSVLWKAIKEGLIQPLDENYKRLEIDEEATFKFLHDRVQQAAYALIDDEQKQAVHLQIGRLLLKNTPTEALDEHLFEIVNQLNEGITLIEDETERVKLAELNLKAGIKAKASMAYQLAINYFTNGFQLLGESAWEEHYAYSFQFHKEKGESEFLLGHFEQVEQLFAIALEKAQSPFDKADIYILKIRQLSAQGQYQAAIATTITGVNMFGLNVPTLEQTELQDKATATEIALYQERMKNRDIEGLWNLPLMQDEKIKVCCKMIASVFDSIVLGRPELLTFYATKMVNMSIQYGLSDSSPVGYVYFAITLGLDFKDYTSAYEFSALALRLNFEKLINLSVKSRVYTISNLFLVLRKPIQMCTEEFQESYRIALESGDFTFAGYTLIDRARYILPFKIKDFINATRDIIEHCKKVNHLPILMTGQMYEGFIKNLQGEVDKNTFNYKNFTEAAFISAFETSAPLLCGIYKRYKLQSLVIFNDYMQALPLVHERSTWIGAFGNLDLSFRSDYFFYTGITVAALYFSAQDKSAYLAILDECIAENQRLAEQCQANFEHAYLILQAEKARIENRPIEVAMRFYDDAIVSAKKHSYLCNEAIANELAAKFWLAQQKENFAQFYLKEAHYCYQQWGALAKVKDLEERYPQCLVRESVATMPTMLTTITHTPTATFFASTQTQTSTSQWLDLETVMKASQILSGEIILSHLLSKMMQIVIENAGAQRGFLILPLDDKWVIEAEGAIDKEEVSILHSLPVSLYLPEAIISYVARTQENVVLTDARQEGLYTENPYIKAHQTKSVLCFPIVYQQQLRAILYFENNLTTGAFTETRLNMLKMLSSQIAISLENARFVKELETARRQAEIANETKTAFLANVSHELRTPLNAILGYTQLFSHETSLSKTFREGSQLIEQSSYYLLTLINDIIDISTLETRKTAIFPVDIRLDLFLNKLIEIFRIRAHEKGLKFNAVFDPSLPLGISSDEKRLRQVLTHLLSNAVKFTQTGEVTMSVMLNEDKIRFQVEDTGIGIAPENLEKIFLPFEQVSEWQHKSEGAGLGLSLAKRLVEALEGELQVNSQLGKGSCFWIDLALNESTEWSGKTIDLSQFPEKMDTLEETESLDELATDADLKEVISLLPAAQVEFFYDLSMAGDIYAFKDQVDELEKLGPQFIPLIEKIHQAVKDYNTDPITELLEPFVKK